VAGTIPEFTRTGTASMLKQPAFLIRSSGDTPEQNRKNLNLTLNI
jgi:hypothetical protein